MFISYLILPQKVVLWRNGRTSDLLSKKVAGSIPPVTKQYNFNLVLVAR